MSEFAGKLPYGKTQCTLTEAKNKMENFKSFNASNLHGVAIGKYFIVSSYNTVIAVAIDGIRKLYLNSQDYGNSTARHKAIIKRAFWNYTIEEIKENDFKMIL